MTVPRSKLESYLKEGEWLKYESTDLWYGSDCAPKGWYLRDQTWYHPKRAGRAYPHREGSFLGSNSEEALNTLENSLL